MIDMEGAAVSIGNWGTAGFSFGLAFFAMRWLAVFLAGRWDKREAQLDSGTQLLVEQLKTQVKALFDRLDQVERDLADCKRQHAESENERMQLKAMLQGYGDARQLAQINAAADKASQEARKERKQ